MFLNVFWKNLSAFRFQPHLLVSSSQKEDPDLPFLNVQLQKPSTHIFNPQHNVGINVKLSAFLMYYVIIRHGFYLSNKHFLITSMLGPQPGTDTNELPLLQESLTFVLTFSILLPWRAIGLKGKNWTKRLNHLCCARLARGFI